MKEENKVKIIINQLRADTEFLKGTAVTYNKILIEKVERMFPEI